MIKQLVVLMLAVCLAMPGVAQETAKPKTAKSTPAAKASAGEAVNKAYLQKIWDGWAALDPAAQKQFYAQGPHVFFDIAPLKYGSWDEYQSGVTGVLADFKSAHCTVNDDAQIHKTGDVYWITATIAFQMAHKSGKIDMGNFRWTAVFEKQNGKWLIVHEHVSEPLA